MLSGSRDRLFSDTVPSDLAATGREEAVNPRFESADSSRRPYVVDAESAWQEGPDDERVFLRRPEARMTGSGRRLDVGRRARRRSRPRERNPDLSRAASMRAPSRGWSCAPNPPASTCAPARPPLPTRCAAAARGASSTQRVAAGGRRAACSAVAAVPPSCCIHRRSRKERGDAKRCGSGGAGGGRVGRRPGDGAVRSRFDRACRDHGRQAGVDGQRKGRHRQRRRRCGAGALSSLRRRSHRLSRRTRRRGGKRHGERDPAYRGRWKRALRDPPKTW